MTGPASSLQLLFVQILLMIYYFITIYRIDRIEGTINKILKILKEKSEPQKEEDNNG